MKTLKNLLKNNKKLFIFIIASIGCIMIFLSYIPKKNNNATQSIPTYNTELEQYGSMLEEKLCSAISRLTGENTVDVMITFTETFETVYAQNTSQASKESFYSLSETMENKPDIIKRNCPKIGGVMIVCMKKLDNSEYMAIKKAASTALNISQSKIYIIGGETSHGKNTHIN